MSLLPTMMVVGTALDFASKLMAGNAAVTAAKRRQAVPLIMVVCEDDDFLLDLRDETGVSVRSVNRINDRWYDESGETIWQSEDMVLFSGSRFLPLFAMPSLF